jgi:hypothetical protein
MDRHRAPPEEAAMTFGSGRPARADGELLLAALRAAREPAAAERMARFDADDWALVLRHAAWHNVQPLLHGRLEPIASLVPSPVMEQLHAAYLASAGKNLRPAGQLAELLGAFDLAGLPVIVLKGAALAECVYGNVAMRGMRDIDVLARTSDLELVHELLTRLGYQQSAPADLVAVQASFHHLPRYTRPRSLPVEVHWTLELPTSPFRIDLDRLWERAEPARIAGQETWVLSPEDLLLHLCIHASYHHHFRVRLRHLADVAATVERYAAALRWHQLIGRARQWGVERFVYTTLSLGRELLRAPVPAHALASLAHDAEDDELVLVAGDFMLAAPVALPIAYREARAAAGIAAKAQVYLGSLFPPPARLREMYGVRPGSWTLPLYYFVRPVDVARRVGRVLAQLGRESDRLPLSLERETNGVRIDGWVAGKEERCR